MAARHSRAAELKMSFDSFLSGYAGNPPELPLVHSTSCERFDAIRSTGVLDPQTCAVFGEPLIYFFYGRPVYRSGKRGVSPDTRFLYCPVCLVLKPNAVSAFARLFPFDSGALDKGLFDPPIAQNHRDRYALGPAVLTAQRLVEAFFETNGAYFVGEPREFFTPPSGEDEVERYWQIVNAAGEAAFDERRSAIEIQSRDALALRDNLHAVIMPTGFLDEPAIRRAVVQDWRAVPITYDTHRGTIPNEYIRDISIKLQLLLKAYF